MESSETKGFASDTSEDDSRCVSYTAVGAHIEEVIPRKF